MVDDGWEACLEEGRDDPAFIVAARGNIARVSCMTGLASKAGLTREGLNKAFSPDGNPEFGMVMRVIQALGLEPHGSGAKASQSRRKPGLRRGVGL
jgi:probable addiction module antidote protein